jgi:hypothetical protein
VGPYILDSTVLSLTIMFLAIVIVPVVIRINRWVRFDPPPIAQNKRLIIGLIGIFVFPVIMILCLLAATLLRILLPYLLAAWAAVIIVLILRMVKKKVDDSFNRQDSNLPPGKPQTLKKAAKATTAKKYIMKY